MSGRQGNVRMDWSLEVEDALELRGDVAVSAGEDIADWIFDEENDDAPASDETTWGPGPAAATVLDLSRSLATAFLVADIGIRLICLQRELETEEPSERWGESIQRYYDTLCHSVEQDDCWRVENAIDCLRERLDVVVATNRGCAGAVAEIETFFQRLRRRCLQTTGCRPK